MNEFAIFSDSACDFPENLVKSHDVNIVPFKFSFDRVTKLTDGVDITTQEFYPKLESSGSVPKTYFPTVRNYVDKFKERLELGQDILCLCMSSKLSKSYISALNAKEILSHIYKNNKIMIFDSLSATGTQALLVLSACNLRASSMEVELVYRKLEEIRSSAIVVFTVSSLDQLAKGGRLSASTAAIGQLLGINPIIYLENGTLVTKGKVFGRSKALEKVKKLAITEMRGNPKNYDFCVLHTRSFAEADIVAREFEAAYGIRQTIPPIEVGMTIGMHTGISVIAIAMVKKI